MRTLQVAIVDDEFLARSRLRRLLEKIAHDRIHIALECIDADELLQQAAKVSLDALFLDIEMPGGDGFDLLQRWPGPLPRVVFVTAYQEYGVKAFDARAVDYLLKPVSAERLRESVDRLQDALATAPATRRVDAAGRRIPLQIGQRTHLVAIDDIDLVSAQGNYLEIRTPECRYVMRGTLGAWAAQLDAEGFVRLHRSTLVRVAAIRELKPLGSGRFRLSLRGGHQVQTSRSFRSVVQSIVQAQAAGPN